MTDRIPFQIADAVANEQIKELGVITDGMEYSE